MTLFCAIFLLAALLIGLAISSVVSSKLRWWSNRIILTLALATAIEGNFLHDIFEYGVFNGAPLDFRSNVPLFWLRNIAWVLVFSLFLFLTTRLRVIPFWMPTLIILSFLLQLLSTLDTRRDVKQAVDSDVEYSEYSFSTKENFIHLLPDGLQGDVVRRVFELNPELAEQFDGFTLFTNHVGLFQATAPSVYTLLTGDAYDLSQGHDNRRIASEIAKKSYPRNLAQSGYRLDFVPITPLACVEEADSCHVRAFADMKARGLARNSRVDMLYSIRLVADLTLFRLSPVFIKEKIYNQGHWLLSDTTLDGSSRWPDPVIREWVANMHLTSDRPVYKFYHYIGTHIPAKWNRDCVLQRNLEQNAGSFFDQTFCVLNGIANLLVQLRKFGIYDQTAIVITGDHGHNIVPDDMSAPPLNGSLYPGLYGSARPALLIKQKNNSEPLSFSRVPSSLLDVAPTILDMLNIKEQSNSLFNLSEEDARIRHYIAYSISDFFSGEPVPHAIYEVNGPAHNASQWKVVNILAFSQPPESYESVNFSTASEFMLGAALNPKESDSEASWVNGRQLAFLLDMPKIQDDMVLNLTLHLPDKFESQGVELSVNGVNMRDEVRFVPVESYWQEIAISLSNDALQTGENFFSLIFDKTYEPKLNSNWRTAALVRSIHVSSAEEITTE